MESGELMRCICVKELSGTAFAGVTVLVRFEVETLPARAFDGAVNTPEVGVYAAAAVTEFEPADTELEEEYEVDAPAPVAPDDAFD